MSANAAWGALTADIVRSRDIQDLRQWRDGKLQAVSRRHQKEGWILAPYAVTAWDEFQTLLSSPDQAARLIFDLRLQFHPHHLRIGVGFGEITGLPKKRQRVNASLGGPAFENARAALDSLKKNRKSEALTAFQSADPELDLALNLIYQLHDTLLRQVTPRQWETITAYAAARRQDLGATGGRMGLNASTVSRSLQRGHYWQMERTVEGVSELLRSRLLAHQRTIS
ncbi:MAG TPA: SatD family protein [Thermoanaerobaculia bacterium]|nr:SatD family protein [Thermoanaerobaculia bacterium]